jgi:hypothetical protein
MHVVALVTVSDGSYFSWLGPKPVVSWVLDTALEARGVDRVVLAVPEELEGLSAAVDLEGVVVTRVADSDWDTVAAAGVQADCIVTLNPAVPFLSTGTVERAVSYVSDEGAPAAATVRRVEGVVGEPDGNPLRRYDGTPFRRGAIVAGFCGCYVLTRGYSRTDLDRDRVKGCRFIEVEEYETLDVSSPRGAALARAWVEAGLG